MDKVRRFIAAEPRKTEPTERNPFTFGYEEAAAMLGIGRRTLQKLVKDGEITPLRIYRRVLFTEAMLTEYIEKNLRQWRKKTRISR